MTHGLIFHYFHNDEISKTQGSIGSNDFEKILDSYAKDHCLLDAEEYIRKAVKGSLQDKDVCITFDDGLYSQYCVADKVLQKRGLTAFYFVYTSPMEGILERMEVYRTFRNQYSAMDMFYEDFFNTLIEYGESKGTDYKNIMKSEEAVNYFSQYEYYSGADRLFRYLRNEILKKEYDLLMDMLMKKRGFVPEEECKNIWISFEQLREMA